MQLKRQYKIFADEYLLHGDMTLAYQKAYPGSAKNSARVRSYSLIQKDDVRKYIQKLQDKIDRKIEQNIVQNATKNETSKLLTLFEKREILAKIARGELIIQTTKQNWNPSKRKFVVESYPTIPDHLTRLRAIDLDSKLAGEYQETPFRFKGSEPGDGFSITHSVVFKDSSDTILINNDNDKNVQS